MGSSIRRAIVLLLSLLGAFLLCGDAGAGIVERLARGELVNLRLRKFRVGYLEGNTNVFVPTGGRDADDVQPYEVLMFEFTAPIDLETIDLRTIRIGIPTTDGLILPAKGEFYRHTENEFFSGHFIPKRTRRNRVMFDPLARWNPDIYTNPHGWDPDALYTVSIAGADGGSLKIVHSTKGSPLMHTFRTTFRTSGAEVDALR